MRAQPPTTAAKPLDEASSNARNEHGSASATPPSTLLAGVGDGNSQRTTSPISAASPDDSDVSAVEPVQTDKNFDTTECLSPPVERIKGAWLLERLAELGLGTFDDLASRAVELADTDGVPLSCAIARGWGMNPEGRFLPIKDLERDQLERLYICVGNIRHLSELLRVQWGTVKYHLKRLGIASLPREKQKRRPSRKKGSRARGTTPQTAA